MQNKQPSIRRSFHGLIIGLGLLLFGGALAGTCDSPPPPIVTPAP